MWCRRSIDFESGAANTLEARSSGQPTSPHSPAQPPSSQNVQSIDQPSHSFDQSIGSPTPAPHPTPSTTEHPLSSTCLDAARAARASARAAPSATARCCATTSRASPSPPSAAWPAVAVSSASPASSTRRPAVCSRYERTNAPCPVHCPRASRRPSHTHTRTPSNPTTTPIPPQPPQPGVPRERDPRLGHLHGARPPQDRHGPRRRVRAQAPGPHALRLVFGTWTDRGTRATTLHRYKTKHQQACIQLTTFFYHISLLHLSRFRGLSRASGVRRGRWVGCLRWCGGLGGGAGEEERRDKGDNNRHTHGSTQPPPKAISLLRFPPVSLSLSTPPQSSQSCLSVWCK